MTADALTDHARRQAARRGAAARGLLVAAVLVPASRVDHGPVLCPVRRATHRPCPGCGMTRSVVRTLHGQLGEAVRAHPAGPALVGLLACWALTGSAHAGSVVDPGACTRTPGRRAVTGVLVLAWLTWAVRRAVVSGRA